MKILPSVLILTCLSLSPSFSAEDNKALDSSLRLASELASEGLHELSALELRRCSLFEDNADSSDQPARAGYLTGAAWEYWKADNSKLSLKMLDQAEAASPSSRNPALLLRGDIELDRHNFIESEFFFTTLSQSEAPVEFKRLAASRLGLIAIKQNNISAARDHLSAASSVEGLRALEVYSSESRKSPRIGGLLGMLPGMGYAYSGEYANALRSVILNGIFIYAMVETGGKDQWGAFSALTFFELTWYSGSIYGGIDSANRYNQRQENAVSEAVGNEFGYQLDMKALPTINIEFTF